jgi:hypothetical protein
MPSNDALELVMHRIDVCPQDEAAWLWYLFVTVLFAFTCGKYTNRNRLLTLMRQWMKLLNSESHRNDFKNNNKNNNNHTRASHPKLRQLLTTSGQEFVARHCRTTSAAVEAAHRSFQQRWKLDDGSLTLERPDDDSRCFDVVCNTCGDVFATLGAYRRHAKRAPMPPLRSNSDDEYDDDDARCLLLYRCCFATSHCTPT